MSLIKLTLVSEAIAGVGEKPTPYLYSDWCRSMSLSLFIGLDIAV